MLDLYHSDGSSYIDSNLRKSILVDNAKYIARVWSAKTIKEQYLMFVSSDIANDYKRDNAQFTLPSMSYFYYNRCPCVSPPVLQSCVDICMSGAMHYIRALNKVSRKRPELKEQLGTCKFVQYKKARIDQWKTYLERRVEDMIISCCQWTQYPNLKYGTGSRTKVSSLVQWKYVRNECTVYGVDGKLQMETCDILSKSTIIIDVLQWINAPRQGAKNDKKDTQLELAMTKLAVKKDVVNKLRASLNVCREHMVQYEWRHLMQTIYHTMSDTDLRSLICTDFGTTLDLAAAEKNNSSG